MNATVTAVVPAYNTAATLGESLDCLLAQTRADWDCIIVDDGSSDDSAAIAEAYCARDPRFRLIRQANAGASAARNTGLFAATGDWVLFLDSDDWVTPDFLDKMLRAGAKNPRAGAIYCGYNRVREDGARLPQDWNENVAENPFRSFSRGCPVVIHGIIVKRPLLVEVGGFDTDLITCEDWDLWQKVARTGTPFVGIPETLAFYRLREGSLSTSTVQMLKDGLTVTSRAWRADPRVPNPARHLAEGRTGDDTDGSPGYFLCWCAGEYAAQGHDCAKLFDSVHHLPKIKDSPDYLAEAIFDGIVAAGQSGPTELLWEAWPEFDRRLGGFFERFEAAAHRPGLARSVREGLRAQMQYENNVAKPTTQTEMMDIKACRGVTPAEGIDTVYVRFRLGDQDLGDTQIPVWGNLSVEEVLKAGAKSLSMRKLLRFSGLAHGPRFWIALAKELMRSAKPALRLALTSSNRRYGLKSLARRVFKRAILRSIPAPRLDDASSVVRVKALIGEIEQDAKAGVAAPQPAGGSKAPSKQDADPTRDPKEFFELVFDTEDPWNYTNAYETLKYEQTLSLMPTDRPIATAMEVACAEGHFTRMLAPRVGRLLAVDIAQKAVDRCRERCADLTNIDYQQFDLIKDAFPKDLDLIVCSEVLYYLEDKDKLKKVAERMRDALAPGGVLLMAHAYQLSDDTSRTGFDWGDDYGGQTITEVFEATPGLALERGIETELYRVNLLRRVAVDAPVKPAVIESGPVALPLDPEVERYVLWGGAVARRSDISDRRSTKLPVLCYHRVADDGPKALADYRVTPKEFEAQMRLLRRHGYHALSSHELADHIAAGRPFRGRPVLITFDDGYQDFADNAWPILQRNDFTAEVFIVTDKVGGVSDWDAEYGPTAPLMDWPTIQALHAQGCRFGSHLATHRSADLLRPDELLREAARSKATLEARLGQPIDTLAAPFGVYDDRLNYVLDLCGYKIAYTTHDLMGSLFADPMALPRVEVVGGMAIEDFAEAVGLELDEDADEEGDAFGQAA